MIFIDTGAFVARYLARDQYHAATTAAWGQLQGGIDHCVTTNHVLDETLTLLARWPGNRFAAARGDALLASRELTIVRPDAHLELAAVRWMERFADQPLSFTDCLSFAVMADAGMARAFTFDHHFRIAGFTTWPD